MAAEVVDPDDGAGSVASRKVLRSSVSSALELGPGPELLAGLLLLSARDDLSARESVEVTRAWTRMISFCTAGQLGSVLDVDRAMNPSTSPRASAAPGRTCSVRATADELATALRIAPRTASVLVAFARRVEELPAAADALAEGLMDLPQLRATETITRDLPGATAREVEAAAVRWAERKTAQQLRVALASEAARLDPAHASKAAKRGVAERDVCWRPSPLPGCGRLVFDLPLLARDAAWHALNSAAKDAKKRGTRTDVSGKGDSSGSGTLETRTLAQLRADLGAAILTGQGDPDGADVPTPRDLARLAEVVVVVAHDTLSGESDLPAHLPGTGPLDPDTARDTASRAPLRRLVVDAELGTLVHRDEHTHPRRNEPHEPHGLLADAQRHGQPAAGLRVDPRLGRMLTDPVRPSFADDGTRYRSTRRLRDHVHTRDRTCLGPACSHPATGTQLDHTINHGERDVRGVLGLTTDDNLGSLCERVHNAKTHGGWQLKQPVVGAFVWTSPTGRTYHRRARPLVPGWRHRRDGPRAPEPDRAPGPDS